MTLSIDFTSPGIIFSTLACLFVFGLAKWTRRIPRGLRLPPGPPGKFILGNLSDMPRKHEWETFTQWATYYGNLVYIKVFRQHIIIVNSMDLAQELFEKRSAIYSDRCEFPMVNDLMGFTWTFALMRYGQKWRTHRKMFHQKFSSTAVAAYHQIQTKQTRTLLQRLYNSPDKFIEHLHYLSGAIIMEIVYGIKVQPTDDPYIEIAEKAMSALGEAANPGAFLVDTFPILKYVPEWMPGAGFRRKARVWRGPITDMCVMPFLAVKKAFSAGTAAPSYIASLLEDLSHRSDVTAIEEEEEIIRDTGAVAYGAGAESTSTALAWFILAMIIYPEAQRKAQLELDSVVGMDRLPRFDDRTNLPYVNALCMEILRWRPVAPLGIAHRVMQDDIYKGYFIPGGSIVIGNSWAILRDEKLYGPETDKFEPGRFLSSSVEYPTPSFGFGRRICPGRHLADNSLFIAAASILKVFNISSAKDSSGNDIPVNVSSSSGAISRPEPFQCSIELRFKSSESLVVQGAD